MAEIAHRHTLGWFPQGGGVGEGEDRIVVGDHRPVPAGEEAELLDGLRIALPQ